MRSFVPLILLCLSGPAWAGPPVWVQNGGSTPRYPRATHLTGFALASSGEAAKNQAAADLAKQIAVRVQQSTTDYASETNGKAAYGVAMITRATTDVRLEGLAYQTHRAGGDHFALAYVLRADTARRFASIRDGALAKARACAASAKKLEAQKQTADALARYLSCAGPVRTAIEADAIGRAVQVKAMLTDDDRVRLAQLNQTIEDRTQALLRNASGSVDDAVKSLVIQLTGQGVSKALAVTVPPLTYGTTRFSSVFGRQFAADITTRLAGAKAKTPLAGISSVVVHGTYVEEGEEVRVSLTVRDVASARPVAGAVARVAKSKIKSALKPANFAQAMKDNRLLGDDELESGKLRVELWTNKGDGDLVYAEGEELKIYMRVNQAAYVRLFYLLANKAKVPLEDAYFIDASKVNRAVEYPDAFEVSAPFGVEQIFAVAYTDKPTPLRTRKATFDGEAYDVVDDRTIVLHRGIKRKKKKGKSAEISEARVSLTTLPR